MFYINLSLVSSLVPVVTQKDPGTSGELLNRKLSSSFNVNSVNITNSSHVLTTSSLLKNLSLHASANHVTTKPDEHIVSSETTKTFDVTGNDTMATTTSTNNTTATATTTIDPVRVQEMRNLYDSDMMLKQGIQLLWIRNRMLA